MNERWKIFDRFEEQKEIVDKRVKEGIEKYRKGDMQITVIDKDGNPVPNATVNICQKDHEFKFGANLFMLDEFESQEKNDKYKQAFTEVFNMATLPFYWSATEPEKGKTRYAKDSEKMYRRPPIDLCIEFCEQNELILRNKRFRQSSYFPFLLHILLSF